MESGGVSDVVLIGSTQDTTIPCLQAEANLVSVTFGPPRDQSAVRHSSRNKLQQVSPPALNESAVKPGPSHPSAA